MAIPTREEEMQMMSHPDKWPLSFILPLIHRGADNRKDNHGFLVQMSMQIPCPAPEPIVYIGLLYEISKEKPISAFNKTEYPSISAIVDDGWEID